MHEQESPKSEQRFWYQGYEQILAGMARFFIEQNSFEGESADAVVESFLESSNGLSAEQRRALEFLLKYHCNLPSGSQLKFHGKTYLFLKDRGKHFIFLQH